MAFHGLGADISAVPNFIFEHLLGLYYDEITPSWLAACLPPPSNRLKLLGSGSVHIILTLDPIESVVQQKSSSTSHTVQYRVTRQPSSAGSSVCLQPLHIRLYCPSSSADPNHRRLSSIVSMYVLHTLEASRCCRAVSRAVLIA